MLRTSNPRISRSEIDMRRGLGFLGLLVTIVIVAVVGVIAYQAGWSDGFAQHLPEAGATAAPVANYPYYYGGPHFFGFGWLFGRLAFGFGRWGHRGWGYGGGWHQYRDDRMREWHDRVHSGQPSESQTP